MKFATQTSTMAVWNDLEEPPMKPRHSRRNPLEHPLAVRPARSFQASLCLAALAFGLSADPARAADAANGRVLYDLNCVSCHGTGGKGDGPTGAALASQGTPARDFTRAEFVYDTDRDGKSGTDADLHAVIENGAGAYGGSPLMAPWAHLGDAAIADIVAHIRTFHP